MCLAKVLIVTCLQSRICCPNSMIFWHFSGVGLIVMVSEHTIKPRNMICWVGSNDFLGWTVKPGEFMSVTVSWMFCKHDSYVIPWRQKSSVYAVLMCPLALNLANIGESTLVNTWGDDVNPIINTVNWYFWLLCQKQKYFRSDSFIRIECPGWSDSVLGAHAILLVLSLGGSDIVWRIHLDRVKRIWYLSPMRAAKVQASLRIRAVSPEPSLLAHTSSESRGTFRQKTRSLAPLNGWTCAVEICHDGMLEDTNSLDGAQILSEGSIWTASSEFGTYRLCEQRRFRRACASAQSRQNLRCSLIQAVSQEEPSDRKPDPWPLWMAGHAQLKFVMTECSKTQIRLTGLRYCLKDPFGPRQANLVLIAYASSEGSGEPAHPRSLARTSAARSYKQWVKRNLQTENQIPGPSEWLDMRSWNLSWRNARRHKFAWRGSHIVWRIHWWFDASYLWKTSSFAAEKFSRVFSSSRTNDKLVPTVFIFLSGCCSFSCSLIVAFCRTCGGHVFDVDGICCGCTTGWMTGCFDCLPYSLKNDSGLT